MELAEFRKLYDRQIAPPYAACQNRYSTYFTIAFEEFASRVYRTVAEQCIEKKEGRGATDREILDCLARLQLFDLYLTAACTLGIDGAWRYFLEHYRGFLERAAATTSSSQAEAEDVAAAVLSELALPARPNETEPKLALYSGIGSLQGWLRVTIGRRVIDRHRRRRGMESLDDSEGSCPAIRLPGDAHNPEEEILRQRYSEAASEAFREALANLETRERLLLLLYYRDGLTLKEIGALPSFRVHEATVSRWLDKIHLRLRKEFEHYLRSTRQLSAGEIAACSEIAMTQCVTDVEGLLAAEA